MDNEVPCHGAKLCGVSGGSATPLQSLSHIALPNFGQLNLPARYCRQSDYSDFHRLRNHFRCFWPLGSQRNGHYWIDPELRGWEPRAKHC